MDIKNIILSTNYLEFINNLDNLIYDLLYSKDGYTLLNSKNAVFQVQNYIKKFQYEAQKLKKDVDFKNSDELIKEKENFFNSIIEKHYKKQAYIWAQNVYQDIISNLFMSLSIIDKTVENIDEIYNKGLCAISWISDVKNYSKEEQEQLIDKFRQDFQKNLNTNDNEYIKKNVTKTNYSIFLKLRSLILDNTQEFLSINFENYNEDLTKEDILLFNKYKSELSSYKKTELKDEIKLVNCAINNLKLKNEDKQYDFIKQINDDLSTFIAKNKTISEQDKVTVLKRRMQLLNDKNSDYFKKLLSF